MQNKIYCIWSIVADPVPTGSMKILLCMHELTPERRYLDPTCEAHLKEWGVLIIYFQNSFNSGLKTEANLSILIICSWKKWGGGAEIPFRMQTGLPHISGWLLLVPLFFFCFFFFAFSLVKVYTLWYISCNLGLFMLQHKPTVHDWKK